MPASPRGRHCTTTHFERLGNFGGGMAQQCAQIRSSVRTGPHVQLSLQRLVVRVVPAFAFRIVGWLMRRSVRRVARQGSGLGEDLLYLV